MKVFLQYKNKGTHTRVYVQQRFKFINDENYCNNISVLFLIKYNLYITLGYIPAAVLPTFLHYLHCT
jgi:hypothetical protein